MWGRLKELFRIPAIVGPGAEKAPLAILTATAPIPPKLKWQVLTDRSVGGKSEASFEISPPANGGEGSEGSESHTTEGITTTTRERVPLAVFSGQLSQLRPSKDPTVKRTGYCAVKIEMPRPLKIDNYEGLELTVKTDGRNYVTNLEVGSFFPDELYQGYMTGLPANKWLTIQLPFRDMTLTRLGRLAYIQRELDSSFSLESIGFLVADGKSGPFRLEIGGIAAVSSVTGRAMEDSRASGTGKGEGKKGKENEEGEG